MDSITRLKKAPVLTDVNWSSGKAWIFEEDFNRRVYDQSPEKTNFDQIYSPKDSGIFTKYLENFYLSYREKSQANLKNSLCERGVYLGIAVAAIIAKIADVALGVLSIPVALLCDLKIRYIDANRSKDAFKECSIQWEILWSSTSASKWSKFTIEQLHCFGLDLLFAEIHGSIFDPSIPSLPKLIIKAPVITVYKLANMILCFCVAPLFSCTSKKSPIESAREVVELSHDLGVSLIASSLLQVCIWNKKLASDNLSYPVFADGDDFYVETKPDDYWARRDECPSYMSSWNRQYPKRDKVEFDRYMADESKAWPVSEMPETYQKKIKLHREVYI